MRSPRGERMRAVMHDPMFSHRGRRAGWWLFAAGLTAYLTLSAQGLLALGIPYDAPWGPFISKLHPGTWLITAAWLVLLFSHGHPMRVAAAQLSTQPLIALYLACIVMMVVYSVARYGTSGAAFMIDTLMMPALAALVLGMLDTPRRRACITLVVALIVVNVLLGIGESIAQARLIPLRLGGESETIENIFRPSALLGHPLANAIVVATVLPLSLYLRTSMAWRAALMLLMWVGLLAFGGRTAFVLATIMYGAWFAAKGVVATLRGRFSYVQLTGFALVAMLSITVLAGAIAASGVGERIFKEFAWDSSAQVRTRIWDVFEFLTDRDMLIGVSPADITDLIWRLGLHGPGESIENFWLVMFLQLGVIGFVPFVIAMASAFAWLWRSSQGAVRLSVLLFFMAASTNNSLASKSISFTMLFIVVAASRRLNIAADVSTVNTVTATIASRDPRHEHSPIWS